MNQKNFRIFDFSFTEKTHPNPSSLFSMQHELDFNTAKTRDYIMSHCFGTEYSVDDILPFSSSWTLYMLRVEENLLAADEFLATFDDDDEIENQNESRQADVMEEKCAE